MTGSEPPVPSENRFTRGLRMDGLYTDDNEWVEKMPSAGPSKKWRACGLHFHNLLISNSLRYRHQQVSDSPTTKTRLPSSGKQNPGNHSRLSGPVLCR